MPAARIKAITFESGSLINATNGVDSTSGTVNLETSAPIKGSDSATIPNTTTGYLAESFSGVNELFVSFYLRPASFPARARIFQIRNGSTTLGEIVLTTSGTLQLKNAGSTIGTSAALSANSVYRTASARKQARPARRRWKHSWPQATRRSVRQHSPATRQRLRLVALHRRFASAQPTRTW